MNVVEIAEGLIVPIYDMAWDLVDVGAPLLLTADRATAFWAAPGKLPAWQGIGLATADEVTFPLTPELCLRLTNEQRSDCALAPKGEAAMRVAAMINTRTFQWSHRFVVSVPGSRPPLLPTAVADEEDAAL
jgi:hypothetical protein